MFLRVVYVNTNIDNIYINDKTFFAIPNLQTNCCLKLDFQNVDQHTEGVIFGCGVNPKARLSAQYFPNFVMTQVNDLYWFHPGCVIALRWHMVRVQEFSTAICYEI